MESARSYLRRISPEVSSSPNIPSSSRSLAAIRLWSSSFAGVRISIPFTAGVTGMGSGKASLGLSACFRLIYFAMMALMSSSFLSAGSMGLGASTSKLLSMLFLMPLMVRFARRFLASISPVLSSSFDSVSSL